MGHLYHGYVSHNQRVVHLFIDGDKSRIYEANNQERMGVNHDKDLAELGKKLRLGDIFKCNLIYDFHDLHDSCSFNGFTEVCQYVSAFKWLYNVC